MDTKMEDWMDRQMDGSMDIKKPDVQLDGHAKNRRMVGLM